MCCHPEWRSLIGGRTSQSLGTRLLMSVLHVLRSENRLYLFLKIQNDFVVVLVFYGHSTRLRSFRRGQLADPHSSCATLLGSLLVQ